MTFQNPEAARRSAFRELGLQAAPVTRLQPIRTVCEQVPFFQGQMKVGQSQSVSLYRSTIAGSTQLTNLK